MKLFVVVFIALVTVGNGLAENDSAQKFTKWLRERRQLPGLPNLGGLVPGGLNLDPSALSGLLTQGTSQFSTLFNGGGFGGLPGLPSGGGLGSLPSLPGGTGGSGGLLGGIGGLTGGGGGLGQISSLTPNKNFLPNANPSGSVGNKEAAKQSLLEQLNVGGH